MVRTFFKGIQWYFTLVETPYLYILNCLGWGGGQRQCFLFWCSSDSKISFLLSYLLNSLDIKWILPSTSYIEIRCIKITCLNCLTIPSTYQKGVTTNKSIFDSFTGKKFTWCNILFSYLRTSSACQAASSSSSQALVFSCQVSKSPSSGWNKRRDAHGKNR